MLTEPRLRNPRRLEWRLNLAVNFILEELVHSDYGLRHDIDNSTDDTNIIAALTALAVNILEPVRAQFGPFYPTSGDRCPDLSRLIGGATNSQHMNGQAADIVLPTVTRYDLALWLQQILDLDQLILELYTPGAQLNRVGAAAHCGSPRYAHYVERKIELESVILVLPSLGDCAA
jgi:zinc D-Ala-D-Ala carboxypeptidase